MIGEEKIELIFKLMNRVRSEYEGMTLSYEYTTDKTTSPTQYLITMNVTGKFPFPLMTFTMFQELFWDFYYRDSKYFGVTMINSGSVVRFNEVIFNGNELDDDEITISGKLKEDLQSFYTKNTKESTLSVRLENPASGKKRINITLVNNKIEYEELNNEDLIYFIFGYTPTEIVLDGHPITTKTMQYYIDNTELTLNSSDDELTVDDIFGSINNLIYEESQDRVFTDNFVVFEQFYDLINNSGYEYNSPLTEEIGIFMRLYLRGFAGIDYVETGDYPNVWDQEVVSNFLVFLEGQNGNYPL